MSFLFYSENVPDESQVYLTPSINPSSSESMIYPSPTPCICEDICADMSLTSEMDYMTSYKPVDITTIVVTNTMTTQISSVEPTTVTITKTTSISEHTYMKSTIASLHPTFSVERISGLFINMHCMYVYM